MKPKILFLSVFFFLFYSCSKTTQYSNFVNFGEENRWQKSDVKTFEFEITNEVPLYTLSFKFSHIYNYQFAIVPINFSIQNPNGKIENLSIDLKIKDADGKQLADCSGDICDLNSTIKEKIKLKKGVYKISISQNFTGAAYLPNVLGIGLDVDIAQ